MSPSRSLKLNLHVSVVLITLVIGASAACKKMTIAGTSLPDNSCVATPSRSFGISCTPTMMTLDEYVGASCTGPVQRTVSQTLPVTDVCGANDIDCRTGIEFYSTASCTTGLASSSDVVPDTCFGGRMKFFCTANDTESVVAMYGTEPCVGTPFGLMTMKNQQCFPLGRSAIRMKSCMNSPNPPAGPGTATADAYLEATMSSTNACAAADKVGSIVFAAGGACVQGNKHYCESTGGTMETVAVSYKNGSLCTGGVVGISRFTVGSCQQVGQPLYVKYSCSAGSSPVKSTQTMSGGLSLEYYADSTCTGNAVGTATRAVGVCMGGDELISCNSGTSATVKKFDSNAGPCNMSQTLPPIVTQTVSASCSGYEGQYVKVVSCMTSDAVYPTASFFAKAFVVAAVFAQFL